LINLTKQCDKIEKWYRTPNFDDWYDISSNPTKKKQNYGCRYKAYLENNIE